MANGNNVDLVGNVTRPCLRANTSSDRIGLKTEVARALRQQPRTRTTPVKEVLTMTHHTRPVSVPDTRRCAHDAPPLDCEFCIEARCAALKATEFWAKVDSSAGPDECWPWTGYAEKGYGLFFWQGRKVGAHELAVTFTTGEARHPELDTCHSCDNPICCNPAHLRFDTRQSNVDEMVERGRAANGQRKLTDDQVLAMRYRAEAGATGIVLAAEYGVSKGLVTSILQGKRWTHVGGPLRAGHGNRIHGKYVRKSGGAS